MKLRAGEERNLTMSPVPIKKAMAELSARGRESTDALKAIADITPQPSDDLGPMVGWIQNPNEAYIDRAAAAAAAPSATTTDGGAAPATAPGTASDAGSSPAAATTDAGAPKAPATPKAPGPKH
jgi:hypothetical protein